MILGFKTHYTEWMIKKGWHTFFDEKIKIGKKIHSIREDKHNRWAVGRIIHFATGVRTKSYEQFHEDVCKSIQYIWIANHPTASEMKIVFIDGVALKTKQLIRLGMYTNTKVINVQFWMSGLTAGSVFWKQTLEI